MKYLINNCGSFWIIRVWVLVYGQQTALSLAQSVPWPPPPPPEEKKGEGAGLLLYIAQSLVD